MATRAVLIREPLRFVVELEKLARIVCRPAEDSPCPGVVAELIPYATVAGVAEMDGGHMDEVNTGEECEGQNDP